MRQLTRGRQRICRIGYIVVFGFLLVYALITACWSSHRHFDWRRFAIISEEALNIERSNSLDDPFRRVVLQEKWREFPAKLFQYLPPHWGNRTRLREDTAGVQVLEADEPPGVCATCFSTVSWHPRVLHFENIITEEEAAHLISIGEESLIRSGVVHKTMKIHTARTSFGTRLSYSDKIALRVSNRLLWVVNHFTHDKNQRVFKAGNAEKLELLRYEGDQEYHGHFDNFGGIDGPVMRSRRNKRRKLHQSLSSTPPEFSLDRAATFIVFLNNMSDIATGGHTTFPFSASGFDQNDPAQMDDNLRSNLERWQKQLERFHTATGDSCNNEVDFDSSVEQEAAKKKKKKKPNSKGDAAGPLGSGGVPPFMKIRPAVGSGVLFYDLYENGVADPFALHSGCPPVSRAALERLNRTGTLDRSLVRKYVITKWFMIPLKV